MNVVTITEDDNATSAYGQNKVKTCLRSDLDCVFFAGPRAGGSAWNRLNRTISSKAATQVEKHQRLYWNLWKHFADALEHVFSIDACALTELPRSCEYWNDERMTQLVNGAGSHTHHFDGCMYGLTSQYNRKCTPIKKPWKILSRGVHFQDLQKTCDGRHQHVPCAGRGARVTQLNTFRIAQTIIETLSERIMSLWKKKHVTSRAPKLQDWSASPHPLLHKEGSSNKQASVSNSIGSFKLRMNQRRRNSMYNHSTMNLNHVPVSMHVIPLY